ncbi:LAME_0F15852g1_1 [Lachancea meyersii CBS 8951]|uniref:LAME_0F15852g1_1 n=1 Tax=Lachancea meyersii CBS 8951 TaxID=1266667 RepID=A0A1G4JYZ7_9SACH|nr:LAME_0F15852g1_1 [Lachancea meyersii CBS 8951]
MDSDLSSVELDAEIYEDSPEISEDDDVLGSEPEEDDEYQYTPDVEEDDETVGLKANSRGRRGALKIGDGEDTKGRSSGRKRVVEHEFDEPESSPAKKPRRNGGIDLQNLDDDEEDTEEANGDQSERTGSVPSQELRVDSRNKMMMELLDNSSRRNSKLSEKELQLRRAENARKRKNLSEKKLEEEKQDTINKLLRRRAGRTRGPVPADREKSESAMDENADFTKPRRAYSSKGMVRVLQNKDGTVYATF